jgi:hypothetical protein
VVEIQVALAALLVASVHQGASARRDALVVLRDAWAVRQGASAFALREVLQDARLVPHRMLPAACQLAPPVHRDQKAQEGASVAAKPQILAQRALQSRASIRLPAQEDEQRRVQQMAEPLASLEPLAGQPQEQGAPAPDRAQQERASAAQLPRVVQQ